MDGAIRAYREAVQLNPLNAHLHAVLANILYDKRDFDAAIRESDEAIRLDPNVASAYYFRGASYQEKTEYSKALVDYNRALHFDPQYANALGGRADVYYFTHQNRLAIEDYTAFIEAFPKSSVAYSRRATCHYALGEYPQTVADYEKAVALDPNLLEAINGLAWTLATAPADGVRNGLKAVGYGERALSLAGKTDKFLLLGYAGGCLCGSRTLYRCRCDANQSHCTDSQGLRRKGKPPGFTSQASMPIKSNKPWRDQPRR